VEEQVRRDGAGTCFTTKPKSGRSLRILSLIDEHTRECLAIHAGYSVRALDAINILEEAIAAQGIPVHIRSDNGPEFIAKAIQDWLKAQRIESLYIKPGSEFHHHVKPQRHLIIARVLRERLELIGQRSIIANFRTDQ
jgi:transposase InsO family protein